MSKNQEILPNAQLIAAILALERNTPESSWECLNNYKSMKAFRRPYFKNKDYYEYVALGEMELGPELRVWGNRQKVMSVQNFCVQNIYQTFFSQCTKPTLTSNTATHGTLTPNLSK